jgi:hypothetical protein|tara:strand:+ start:230 stop:517 length:288 start_codon:yes stop_codon:yes gene_type:complete
LEQVVQIKLRETIVFLALLPQQVVVKEENYQQVVVTLEQVDPEVEGQLVILVVLLELQIKVLQAEVVVVIVDMVVEVVEPQKLETQTQMVKVAME